MTAARSCPPAPGPLEACAARFDPLSHSWNAEAANAQRLALLAAEPAIAPHIEGVLVFDDIGDREAGCATEHVTRQYLGSVGKIATHAPSVGGRPSWRS